MKRPSKPALLAEMVDTLVRHFGEERVRAALLKNSTATARAAKERRPQAAPSDSKPASVNIADAIEEIREVDSRKHELLNEFFVRLKDRQSLPDSQDIRHFAQLVGIKHIAGKSRKEMVPQLLRFLLTLPTERLQTEIQRADDISEPQRQQGFSILTDKLLGEK